MVRDVTPNKSLISARAEGRQLLSDMLIELQNEGLVAAYIENRERAGGPQTGVVGRFLKSAMEHPGIEQGFVAALTDYLGNALDETIIVPSFYGELDEHDISRGFTEEEGGEDAYRDALRQAGRHLKLVIV